MESPRSNYTKLMVIIMPLASLQLVIIISCGLMHTAYLKFEQCFLQMKWGDK